MLVAAAVLPHPPLLVPEVAAGAADELVGLRAACRKAIDTVLESDLQRVVVVGGGAVRATFGPGARGSLAGFGVPVEVCVPGAAPTGEVVLPLSATIGCWMLHDVRSDPGPTGCSVTVEVVGSDTSPQGAGELGAELVASADRMGLLVMGDGSAALSPKAPGYVVEGATEWQRRVDHALGSADVDAVAALSADDADRYLAMGRAAWQVLAGAVRAGEGPDTTWRSTLLAAEAPYGVGYTVAAWERVGR
jgi:hypothetical protein